MNVKETASKCKSRRKRTRGALQEAHHHTHQATGAAAARFHRRPPFVSAVSNRGADPGRQSNTTPAATHCATYHRLILLCTPEFRSTTSLLLHLPRPYVDLRLFRGCRPGAGRSTVPAVAPRHRFRPNDGGVGIGVGGGRPWDSTRIDQSTCTSSHWHDLTSSYRM
jgi:hypothetical protein